jgi:hypothetical protein
MIDFKSQFTEKWLVTFTDHNGKSGGGFCNNYEHLQGLIKRIRELGGTDIKIEDHTHKAYIKCLTEQEND